MKRPAIPLITAAAMLMAGAANATKLDLFSDVEIKTANYQHLIYGDARGSQALYSENAALGFVIKNIKLEKTPSSTMDVGIVLQSIGAGSSSTTIASPQFADAINRLPSSDGTPFLREAYVKIYKFLNPKVTATFGRQDFTLGQGITLGSDDLGFPGARLEIANAWRGIKADFFFFRPSRDYAYHKIYGSSIYYPANEGLWQVYHFWEQDDTLSQELNFNASSKTKKFTGLRYYLSQNQLTFDGEAVIQRGSAEKAAGGKAGYEGHAFMMKGSWRQNVPLFGEGKVRLAYGRASGNAGYGTDKDTAFFPEFGSRYKGLERKGYGVIAGATLYDIIKTSATTNGLPNGVSGLNVIDIGADLHYKKILLSADLYKYRASENANDGSLQIGSELDLQAALPLSENMSLNLVYAFFTPLGLYQDTDPIKMVYASVSARF